MYIGKIPLDMFEPELVPALERFGTIYELRLLMGQDSSKVLCLFWRWVYYVSSLFHCVSHSPTFTHSLGRTADMRT